MKSSHLRPFYAVGSFLLLTGIACSPQMPSQGATKAATNARRFDFGDATKESGYALVNSTTLFSTDKGYGWLAYNELFSRQRAQSDDLRSDFVAGKNRQTFRVSGLTPGRYALKVICGDADYGDHTVQVGVEGAGPLPLLSPAQGEFLTLSLMVNTTGTLDIDFDSPQNNWIVNALTLEPTTTDSKPTVYSQTEAPPSPKSQWNPQVFEKNPVKPLVDAFLVNNKGKNPAGFRATGLSRADYLRLITRQVDFWKSKQNADGAIIDPYRKEEWQYSTPAFAHAAAVLIVYDKRDDLLESASKAMDWATLRLSQRRAATGHEDFYPPMLAHALRLLKSRVAPERTAQWEKNLRSFDPYKTYRTGVGSGNWNIVSSSGEFLFQKLGVRDVSNRYATDSFAAQGRHFASPYGLYTEGPMAYDHFPRIFVADVLGQGYDGPYAKELDQTLGRAALTSLFMQSPWGELPSGGRSAHHQWNEAEQCLTYEIYAAKAQKEGDALLAGVYKRAAHLALSSMQRWVRPSGEMQIVKNWVDPEKRHAFESYSAHSQYNLLPMSMLASAYEYAASTDKIAERPAPADRGGFVFQVAELNKIFANAGGTYVELDTNGNHHYDATGLIRVHMKGLSPQLGPSDSVLAHASYQSPNPAPLNVGVGAAWQNAAGVWHTLGDLEASKITSVTMKSLSQTPSRVAFEVTYQGDLGGTSRLVEQYVLTPQGVELTVELPGYKGPLRLMWPVLTDDGRNQTTIDVKGVTVSVSGDGGKTAQTFTARGAQNVRVEEERYSNHNGWARLAVAQYPTAGKITLVIAPTRNAR